MSYINYNPTAQQGFQNALAMGMQMGAQAREARERNRRNSALAAYAVDPSDANFGSLAEAAPEIAIQERSNMNARAAAQQEAQLVDAAMSGDKAALQRLATVNFDKWKALDGQQRQALEQEAEVYGNAALDVLNLPPEQRAQAVMGYANSLGSQEIAQLAELPPRELEAALRAQVAESGMIKELQAMERPDYTPVGYDQTLVNVRDPNAVAQFGVTANGGSNVPPPPPGFVIDGGGAGNSVGGF